MAIPEDLIETILRRARERKLAWSVLSANGFVAPIGLNMIIIDRAPGGGITGGISGEYTLRITDENGTVIESGRSKDWEELYELARRQALGADEILSRVKRNLEEL